MAVGYGEPAPKPEPRQRTKARAQRAKDAHVKAVRKDVFAANDDTCVVCGWRAESMHEISPASVVGNRIEATTTTNSVPLCGSGTTKCHGLMQQKILLPVHGKSRMRFMVDMDYASHPEVVELAKRMAARRTA